MEGGKPENPEKNPRSKDENQQQTQPTYDTGGRESNPGHIGGRRVLSPLRHPCSPNFLKSFEDQSCFPFSYQFQTGEMTLLRSQIENVE